MREINTTPSSPSEEVDIISNTFCGNGGVGVPVVKQVITVHLEDKMQTPGSDDEPLCDDILSCISALDDVIAEFDDSISQSSFVHVLGGEDGSLESVATPKPTPSVISSVSSIPRVTCSVNSTSLSEPTVKILQTHEQTVTEIQIGSTISETPSVIGSPPKRMSGTKVPSAIPLPRHSHNEPLQLKQSHFSPVKGSPKKTVEPDGQVYQVEISGENCSPTGNFTSYGIIFPKNNSNTTNVVSSPTREATTVAPPAPYPRTRRAAAKMVDPKSRMSQESQMGGSFPKVKEPIYEVIAESQSVKVRPSPKSGAHKGMPLFIAETTPAEELANEQKRAHLLKSEEWSFHSDEKLPRSLRKTRRTCLEEDDDQVEVKSVTGSTSSSGSHGNVTVPSNLNGGVSSSPVKSGPPVNVRGATHAVQVHVAMSRNGLDSGDKDEEIRMKTSSAAVTGRGNEDDIWRMPVTHVQKNDHKQNTVATAGASGNSHPAPLQIVENGNEKKLLSQAVGANGKVTYSKATGSENGGNGVPLRSHFNGLPLTPPVLDVDDGYLSMINRHETPILWPEGFIESETFSPEELKTLTVHHPEDYDSKTRVSGATDKTDYFSDDSLEFEGEGDEPRTFIITGPSILQNARDHRRKSLADVDHFQSFAQEATSRKSWSVPSGTEQSNRNVWKIGSPEPKNSCNSLPRELATSSPVRKPCAFFIPLNDSEVCESQGKTIESPVILDSEKQKSLNSPHSAPSPIVSLSNTTFESHILKTNSEAFVFDFSDPPPEPRKAQPLARNPSNRFSPGSLTDFVDTLIGKALKTGMQEADAINYLLATPDEEEPVTIEQVLSASPDFTTKNEDLVITLDGADEVGKEEDREDNFLTLERLSNASSGKASPSDVPSAMTETSFLEHLSTPMEPISQISSFGSDEEEEVEEEKVELTEEVQEPVPEEVIPLPTSTVTVEETTQDEQPISPVVISPTESNAEKVRFDFIEDLHDQPPPFVPAPPPISVIVVTPKETTKEEDSDDSFNANPVVIRDLLDFPRNERRRPEKHSRAIPEEILSRSPSKQSHIHRQTSRSHENLVDIVGRRYGYLSPTGSHGHSSTLPPNSMPPVHRRRSALRTFIDYFKRGKKMDYNTQIEDGHYYPDTPNSSSPKEGKKFVFNGIETSERSLEDQIPENLKISRISMNDSPRGSQRSSSSRSGPAKKGVLSRLFRRKEK